MPKPNTQAPRLSRPHTTQTYRAATMQGYGPAPQHTTSARHPQPQTQPRDAAPSQGSQQALGASFQATMALAAPSQRPLQTQAPLRPASQPSAPPRQVPQTSYQAFRPSYSQDGQVKDAGESLGWQGSQTGPCLQRESTAHWQEGAEAGHGHGRGRWTHSNISRGGHPHSTLPRTTPAMTPGAAGTLTAPQTFGTPWQQQQQQYSAGNGLWGVQSVEAAPQVPEVGGGSSLQQECPPPANVESSSVSELPRAPHNAPPPPHTTAAADGTFTSLESEYQSSVASSRSHSHYSSNITQLQAPSESPAEDRRAAPFPRPVAGVRPLVVGGASARKREPDPFSHLTKMWEEMQRGRGKGRLSNFCLPTASPRRPERQTPATPTQTPTPTPTPTPPPGGQDDDWRDLEMFQWCRRQERLGLHSLYKHDNHHQAGAQMSPASQKPPQGSSLQITYDSGSRGPVLGVGLSGMGGARQRINLNFSRLDDHSGATTGTQVSHSARRPSTRRRVRQGNRSRQKRAV